eukprot:8138438-Pyramimonas_sp.AAC.1
MARGGVKTYSVLTPPRQTLQHAKPSSFAHSSEHVLLFYTFPGRSALGCLGRGASPRQVRYVASCRVAVVWGVSVFALSQSLRGESNENGTWARWREERI